MKILKSIIIVILSIFTIIASINLYLDQKNNQRTIINTPSENQLKSELLSDNDQASEHQTKASKSKNTPFLIHIVDQKKQNLRFYWKDENGNNLKNFQNLKDWLHKEGKELVFATNGGMYKTDLAPLGLYIEDSKTLAKLNPYENEYGNFYLKPNGIFYLTTDNIAKIVKTEDFDPNDNVQYATQSGPLLLIDGDIHPQFTQGSVNLNIRNGVGILPDGKVLFAMSTSKLINFYDFALFFKDKGCKYALYLDGFVSRTYLPSADWEELEGNFGVIIGETKDIK